MTNEQLFTGLLLLAIGLVANGWVKYYYEYFKKSGELQAMKENVEALTKQTETITTELRFIADQQLGLVNERRRVIYSFHSALSIWANTAIGTLPEHPTEFESEFDNVKAKYRVFEDAHSEFQLLFPHIKEIDNRVDIIVETILALTRTDVVLAKEIAENSNETQIKRAKDAYATDRQTMLTNIYSNLYELRNSLRKLIEHKKGLN